MDLVHFQALYNRGTELDGPTESCYVYIFKIPLEGSNISGQKASCSEVLCIAGHPTLVFRVPPNQSANEKQTPSRQQVRRIQSHNMQGLLDG